MNDTTHFAVQDPLFGTEPMAVEPEALTDILAAYERKIDALIAMPAPQSLAAYRAARDARTAYAERRGKVGILRIQGPLVKRASWISQALGWTDYATLMQDFTSLVDNKDVAAIALYVDTPGGEVSGCSALASAIYSARGKKPITAYVSGLACSAGYWIASAADRVATSSLGTIGSIGVAMTVTDRKKADEARGVKHVEFVSSQSPGKRPDINTDAGKAQIQKIVDDLGAVFVAAVAKHRGVTTDTVLRKFGRGSVEIGANAVKVGMADEVVGQFEDVLKRLQPGSSRSVARASVSAATRMASGLPAATSPEASAAAVGPTEAEIAAAVAAEEARRKAATAASWKAALDRTNASGAPGAVADPTADAPWRKRPN